MSLQTFTAQIFFRRARPPKHKKSKEKVFAREKWKINGFWRGFLIVLD